MGVAWWVGWVWAWLIFFSLLWAVVVVVVVVGVADGRVGLFCSAILAVVVPCFVVLGF